MKQFKISWIGSVVIGAHSENEARRIFEEVDLNADDEYQHLRVEEVKERQNNLPDEGQRPPK
jgi:hypothetical protein